MIIDMKNGLIYRMLLVLMYHIINEFHILLYEQCLIVDGSDSGVEDVDEVQQSAERLSVPLNASLCLQW
jgi:hypothetical protein